MPPPSSQNCIREPIRCKQCLREMPEAAVPSEYFHTEVGWTPQGIQVWCLTHDSNIAHVDFGGHKLIVNEIFRKDSY